MLLTGHQVDKSVDEVWSSRGQLGTTGVDAVVAALMRIRARAGDSAKFGYPCVIACDIAQHQSFGQVG